MIGKCPRGAAVNGSEAIARLRDFAAGSGRCPDIAVIVLRRPT
jgi:hypothetical protein